eukprot:TRINITY_DN891_c0_g3_i2.p1 TRINITY_DN891_c0_g3~~TRINITY_DN891_c0_g3_i2.p1  ORF type:complete len:183 (-),score=36.08 TRINITY_DN891_c0_g3_i2:91-639(-)
MITHRSTSEGSLVEIDDPRNPMSRNGWKYVTRVSMWTNKRIRSAHSQYASYSWEDNTTFYIFDITFNQTPDDILREDFLKSAGRAALDIGHTRIDFRTQRGIYHWDIPEYFLAVIHASKNRVGFDFVNLNLPMDVLDHNREESIPRTDLGDYVKEKKEKRPKGLIQSLSVKRRKKDKQRVLE